jgi:hypothetical protein
MKVILVSVLSLAAVPAAVDGQRATKLDEVMRRAHTYVAIYEDHELSSLISREHYQQQLLRADERVKEQRTLLSDYVLFQLPPDEDWFALRDVYDVDGAPVPDRADRLKALFDAPRDQIGERAMAIDRDSARFNLGDVPRTVNLPTFALRFLRPANRKRFDFKKQAEERVGDTVTWVVGYRETKSPTFTVSTDGRDVPASGRFWIDPETGAVLKTEMILGGTRGLRSRATVTVTYTLKPSLGFRVPTEMRERYDNPRRKGDDVIVALATYSNFRPVDWRALK